MQHLIPLLILLATLPSLAYGSHGWVHPGITNNNSEFSLMASKVAAGAQPWTTAYNQIPNYANYVPTAVSSLNITTSRDGTHPSWNIYRDAVAAYGSALRWRVTGTQSHAAKAIEIINDWTYTLTSVTGDSQVRLDMSWFWWRMIAAAEILKYTPGSGWSTADQNAFTTNIINAFIIPRLQSTAIDGSQGNVGKNNWAAFGMVTRMALGVYLESHTHYDQAVTDFQSLVTFQVSSFGLPVPQGFLWETCRSTGGGAPGAPGTLTGGAMDYVSFNLAAFTAATEITKKQGTHNLYGFVGADDGWSFRDAILLHVAWTDYPQRSSATNAGWPCAVPLENADNGGWLGQWHMAYNHWGDTSLKQASDYVGNTYGGTLWPATGPAWPRLSHSYAGQVTPAPTINVFSANPTAVASGSSSTLTCDATDATGGCTINQNLGTCCSTATACEAGATKSTGALAATTTYTLTCTNASGEDTAQTTVTVNPVGPTINIFSANPTSITQGNSSTLSWDATNATSGCSINQAVGTVCANATACETGGTTPVSPTATTTYTLTCTNVSGNTTAQATVTVTPPGGGTLALAYASPTGSPTAPCTQAAPCDLPTAAGQLASSGTLRLLNGTYTLSTPLILPGGTASSPTVLESANLSGSPILVGNRQLSVNPGLATLQAAADHIIDLPPPRAFIIIRNLTITTTGSGSTAAVRVGSQSGTSVTGDVTFDNVDVQCPTRTSTAAGIRSYQTTTARLQIQRSRIHRCGPAVDFAVVSPTVHGLDLRGADITVEDSDIYDNAGVGIQIICTGCSTANPRTIVRNNRVYGNGDKGMFIGDGDAQVVDHNLVYGNGDQGIYHTNTATRYLSYQNSVHANSQQVGGSFPGIFSNTSADGVIRNNISLGHPVGEISILGTATAVACSHNLSSDASETASCTNWTLNGVAGNVWVDPTHATLASRNYTLKVGSVAIDAGTTGVCTTADVSANRCPAALTLSGFIGAAPDQGARESSAVAPQQLVGDYDFDNDVEDDSTANNDGTQTGVTFDATNKIEGTHAALFDAAADRVTIPLAGLSQKNFTIAISARPTAFGSTRPTYLLGHTSDPAYGYIDRIQLYLSPTGNLAVGLGASHVTLSNLRAFTLNSYHRVVMRVQEGATPGSGTVRVSVNNVLVGTGTYSGLSQLGTTAAIGNNGASPTEGWLGQLDRVLIANYVWTDAEVAADCTAFCTPAVSPFDPLVLRECRITPVTPDRIGCQALDNPDPAVCTTLTDFVVSADEIVQTITACTLVGARPGTLTLTLAAAIPVGPTVELFHKPTDVTYLVNNQQAFDPLVIQSCATDASGLQALCPLTGTPDPAECQDLSNFLMQDQCVAVALAGCAITTDSQVGGSTLVLTRQSPPANATVLIQLFLRDENQSVAVQNNFNPAAVLAGISEPGWRCREDGPDDTTPWSTPANFLCGVFSPGGINLRFSLANTSGSSRDDFGTTLACALNGGAFLAITDTFNATRVKYSGPIPNRVPDQQLITTPALPIAGGLTFAPVGRFRRQAFEASKPILGHNQQMETEHAVVLDGGLTTTDTLVCRLQDPSGQPFGSYVGLAGCTTHCGAALAPQEACP